MELIKGIWLFFKYALLPISVVAGVYTILDLYKKDKNNREQIKTIKDFQKTYEKNQGPRNLALEEEHRPILELGTCTMTNTLSRQGVISIVNKGATAKILGIKDNSKGVAMIFYPNELRKDNSPYSIPFKIVFEDQFDHNKPNYKIDFTLEIENALGVKWVASINTIFENNRHSPLLFRFNRLEK